MSLCNEYIYESIDTIKDLDSIESLTIKLCGGVPSKRYNRSKQNIIRLLSIPEDYLSETAPLYAYNPYVSAFFSAKSDVLSPLLIDSDINMIFKGSLESNEVYQRFKEALRSHTSKPHFNNTIKKLRKSQTEREIRINRYIDALKDNYARMLIVRLDLHLKIAPDRVNFTRDLLADMTRFWSLFRRDLNESSAIPKPVGFIGSLEHGHNRGFHFHVMLIYDGSKHQKDILIAYQIGEHWKLSITNGKGDYHNCNAINPSRYKHYGIGRVDYWDTDKISNLKIAARYLAKIDFSLQAIVNKNRTFFRGNMPSSSMRSGRPRKISIPKYENF
jgi:hypothetical protein